MKIYSKYLPRSVWHWSLPNHFSSGCTW